MLRRLTLWVCGVVAGFLIGHTFGWLVPIVAVVTFFVGQSLLVWRWKRTLPFATLAVDGHILKFQYYSENVAGGFKVFRNLQTEIVDGKDYYAILMRATQLPLIVDEFNQESTYLATFTIENETIHFFMDVQGKRCPCDRTPPCWIGKEYYSNFVFLQDQSFWQGVIRITKIDTNYRGRRRPRKIRKEAPVPDTDLVLETVSI